MGPKTPRSLKQKGTGASANGGGDGAPVKQFKAGDKVFVEDGDWFWSAKIREGHDQLQPNQYIIHYDGWNQRHDEIVEADCVFPWTEENQERSKRAQVQKYKNTVQK